VLDSAIVSLHVCAVGCAVGVSGPRRGSSDPGVIVPSVLPPSVIHSTYLRVPRATRVLPASRCLLSRSPPLRRIVSPGAVNPCATLSLPPLQLPVLTELPLPDAT